MTQEIHQDQLICCECGYREIARHNIACPHCPDSTMSYERAIVELDRWKKHGIIPPKPEGQAEVSGQISLFWGDMP